MSPPPFGGGVVGDGNGSTLQGPGAVYGAGGWAFPSHPHSPPLNSVPHPPTATPEARLHKTRQHTCVPREGPTGTPDPPPKSPADEVPPTPVTPGPSGGGGGNGTGGGSGWESVRMGGSDNEGDGLASQPRRYRVPGQPLLNRHQVGGVSRSPDGLFAQQEWEPIRGRPAVRGKGTYGGRDNAWRNRAPGPHAHTLTETQRGRLWTACEQRCVDSKTSQTTPATTSTTPNAPTTGRH